jgi:hypothetical protein
MVDVASLVYASGATGPDAICKKIIIFEAIQIRAASALRMITKTIP